MRFSREITNLFNINKLKFVVLLLPIISAVNANNSAYLKFLPTSTIIAGCNINYTNGFNYYYEIPVNNGNKVSTAHQLFLNNKMYNISNITISLTTLPCNNRTNKTISNDQHKDNNVIIDNNITKTRFYNFILELTICILAITCIEIVPFIWKYFYRTSIVSWRLLRLYIYNINCQNHFVLWKSWLLQIMQGGILRQIEALGVGQNADGEHQKQQQNCRYHLTICALVTTKIFGIYSIHQNTTAPTPEATSSTSRILLLTTSPTPSIPVIADCDSKDKKKTAETDFLLIAIPTEYPQQLQQQKYHYDDANENFSVNYTKKHRNRKKRRCHCKRKLLQHKQERKRTQNNKNASNNNLRAMPGNCSVCLIKWQQHNKTKTTPTTTINKWFFKMPCYFYSGCFCYCYCCCCSGKSCCFCCDDRWWCWYWRCCSCNCMYYCNLCQCYYYYNCCCCQQLSNCGNGIGNCQTNKKNGNGGKKKQEPQVSKPQPHEIFANFVNQQKVYISSYYYQRLVHIFQAISAVECQQRHQQYPLCTDSSANNSNYNQMSCMANDQQLQANNLCRTFRNNRKRHRRRRRRRRRRRIIHREQQQHQQLLRQSNNIIKRESSGRENIQLTINAFKTITKVISTPTITTATKNRTKTLLSTINSPTLTVVPPRIYKRRAKPNLVWLFIGLVWFEVPKLVNCSIISYNQQQQESAKILTAKAIIQTKDNNLKEFVELKNIENCTNKIHPNKRTVVLPSASASVLATKNISILNQYDKSHRRAKPVAVSSTNLLWNDIGYARKQEINAQSDNMRLESIKRQILSKLGLTRKPNVSHPLPKQFIWDTIYRADGLSSVRDYDFNDNRLNQLRVVFSPSNILTQKNIIRINSKNNMDVNHATSAVLAIANHQKEYPKNLSNITTTLNFVRYRQEELKKKQQFNSKYKSSLLKGRNRSNSRSNSKLTYLTGINSLSRLSDYDDLNYKGIQDTKSIDGLEEQQQHPEYLPKQNLYENEDFFGSTQEIITFAEKGNLYKHHWLVEFSPQTNELPNQKLYIRNAEIHLYIDKIIGEIKENVGHKKFMSGSKRKNRIYRSGDKTKLKIWIFQIIGNNYTDKGFDQVAHFSASYDVDIMRLGWQKFDLTYTVRQWYGRTSTDKLKLLIDCTGCGHQYILRLFNHHIEGRDNYQPTKKQEQQHQQPRQQKNNNNDNQHNFYINKYSKKNRKSEYLNNYRYSFPTTTTTAGRTSSIDCNNKPIVSSITEIYNLDEIQRNQRQSHSESQQISPYRPFLVLHTEPKRLRRMRRRAIDCMGALNGQCCKESFYVSFKALGWDDWIIAPRGYFANYCRGDCTGPFRTPDTFQTFHAHFIEEYRKIGLLNGMQPCCAPIKFSSMSLIYYGDDGIIKRDLPKMVVDECGCP